MDTIAALATPPGKGGVGIIRVSGELASSILSRIAPAWPVDTPSHLLRLTSLRQPDGALIDEALVVVMRAPNSYTGEDVVELQCHGGPVILRKALDCVLSLGARHARPGEFTERAFLHGKLDLTQAEAVADLIEAESEAAHRLAAEHLEGGLGNKIASLLELLVQCMMLVESALDFSHEEHVYQIERDEIERRLRHVLSELEALSSRFDAGRRVREGIKVVVAGAANAGKSTLFNAIHGTDRAIVTEIAGTTRDFLEEELVLGGVSIRLVDTAGLRDTSDKVESIGIERSLAWLKRADLLLWVIDQSSPLEPRVRDELQQTIASDIPTVIVLNKEDLDRGLSFGDMQIIEQFEHVVHASLGGNPPRGLSELVQLLERHAISLTSSEGVLLSRTRHYEQVQKSARAIEQALEALAMGAEHELLAMDIRDGLDALGAIVGKVSTDDILNRIFGEFCVGK